MVGSACSPLNRFAPSVAMLRSLSMRPAGTDSRAVRRSRVSIPLADGRRN